jgi:hypothetical protein
LQTEAEFNKLLNIYGNNYLGLINSIIDYRISEITKGIKNLEFDINNFENKYEMSSSEFYNKYNSGSFGDDIHQNDFMIWCSEYESYIEFQNELNQIK